MTHLTVGGHLKIYLGYAPGVGKTYQMLEEARDLKAHGADLVVGFVESHGRADIRDQLDDFAMPRDPQAAGPDLELRAFGIERAAEHDLLGILRDVDEAAGTDGDATKLGDVHVADLIDLAEAEKCEIQSAARIEVEL